MGQTLEDNVKAMMAAGVPEADIARFVKKYDADAAKPVATASTSSATATPTPNGLSYGDMARSVRDTAAEFLPMAGVAIGSAFGGVPGALTGQAAGQGYRGLIQRGGEFPAAIADIYRNLQSGDPDVRGATMRGFQRGEDEGTINLVPGGRGSQAAVANLRAGNRYSAAADTLGALIDVGMVSGAAPIAKAFTTNAPRATIGTLLGLGGSKVGGMVGGAVADKVGMTPDQRVLAEAVGSTVGFPLVASLAHPKVPVIARAVAENPIVQGATSAAVTAASGAGVPAIVAAGLSPSLVNKGVRIYREGLASKERMQERRITAKREDVAKKLTSDATLLAEARAERAKIISAKQQSDLFKLNQAHQNRLERDVRQAGTKSEQDALKRSQEVGDVLESREYAALLAKDKAAAKVLESKLQDEILTSRDGKTAQIRQEAFDRADAIRAQQAKLALEKETRTRDNALSDAAARNARQAEITAAHMAAQLEKTHLSNVESILKAQTPDALNTAKQMADYHLELADTIDPDLRAALQGKIDQVFETQFATMAERSAAQNAQLQGLESKDISATRSSSTVDDNNTRQRVTEVFGKPKPAKEPMPQQDAPASRPAAEPKGSAPKTKPSGEVTPDNVLERLEGMDAIRQSLKNRPDLRLVVIAQRLADMPLHTPQSDLLRQEYSGLYRMLTGKPPSGLTQFAPSHVQGIWFASGMNPSDKTLLAAALQNAK